MLFGRKTSDNIKSASKSAHFGITRAVKAQTLNGCQSKIASFCQKVKTSMDGLNRLDLPGSGMVQSAKVRKFEAGHFKTLYSPFIFIGPWKFLYDPTVNTTNSFFLRKVTKVEICRLLNSTYRFPKLRICFNFGCIGLSSFLWWQEKI